MSTRGLDHLAEVGVGNPHDDGVGHGGVPVEHFLDVARVDLLAADVDHVLGAIDDGDVSLVVHPDEVAGLEPAVGGEDVGGRLGLLEVAGRDRRAVGPELADRAGREGVPSASTTFSSVSPMARPHEPGASRRGWSW